MIKFEFEKAYEDIEISGETYRISIADDCVKKFQSLFFELEKNTKTDAELLKLSVEEKDKLYDKDLEDIKNIISSVLVKGDSKKLYEQAGHSKVILMSFLKLIDKVFTEKMENVKVDARKNYVKKNK